MSNEISDTGWVLAWRSKLHKGFQFELFLDRVAGRPSSYGYWSAINQQHINGLSARERAEVELQALLDGTANKWGLAVVDGYVVRGRMVNGRIVPDCGREQARPPNVVEII